MVCYSELSSKETRGQERQVLEHTTGTQSIFLRIPLSSKDARKVRRARSRVNQASGGTYHKYSKYFPEDPFKFKAGKKGQEAG